MYTGILKSTNKNTIKLCREISTNIQIEIIVCEDIASLLLAVHENDYQVAILDCEIIEPMCIKWIRFIRRLYPKLSVVVLCNEIDLNQGAKIYEEKIFYLGLHPLDRQNFQDVLTASLRFSACKE